MGDNIKPQVPIRFSGIVVAFNEEKHLPACLSSLSFCDELIVVDLGSTDGSLQIAADFGAKIVHHEWVPVIEHVRKFAVKQAENDWVVFIDPDMMFQTHLVPRICRIIEEEGKIGAITIPIRNYFLEKPLYHTRWGKLLYYPAVMHRNRINLLQFVHHGIQIREGFGCSTIGPGKNEENVMCHYWVDSYAELIEKHMRYLQEEGESLYLKGKSFSWLCMLFSVPWEIGSSLILYKGIMGGKTGWFLSIFWGWYIIMCWLSLRDYQSHYKLDSSRQTSRGNIPRLPRKVCCMLNYAARLFLWLANPSVSTFSTSLKLAGDRDIEWSWVGSQMPSGPGEALDFGPGGSHLGLLAAQRGFNVISVDLEPVHWPYVHSRLKFVRGDILKISFSPEHFDLIINCSTAEHVGLSGRYGVEEDQPDGDIEAMARLLTLMKPGGVMLLTIPVGKDEVFPPLHRIYGAERLPKLINRYVIKKEDYWIKDEQNRWIKVDRNVALSRQPQRYLYGLGCFVLGLE